MNAGLDFKSIKNNSEFSSILGKLYEKVETESNRELPQIWHTPTELFKPHYGNSIADFLLTEFDKSTYPTLVIYEIGAGNGTLMRNILDYIQTTRPEIYATAEYIIIEISPKLARKQNESLRESVEVHDGKVRIVNQSILEWTTLEPRPCFFLAMEVIVCKVKSNNPRTIFHMIL